MTISHVPTDMPTELTCDSALLSLDNGLGRLPHDGGARCRRATGESLGVLVVNSAGVGARISALRSRSTTCAWRLALGVRGGGMPAFMRAAQQVG